VRGPAPTLFITSIMTKNGESPSTTTKNYSSLLFLEGAQAGLSWITICDVREGYRKAFANFDPKKVAKFDKKKIASILKTLELFEIS